MTEALAKKLYVVPFLLSGAGGPTSGPAQMFCYGMTQNELQDRLNHCAVPFLQLNVMSEEPSGYTQVVVNRLNIVALYKELEWAEVEKGKPVIAGQQKLPPITKGMN